jgi:hypothetical protein
MKIITLLFTSTLLSATCLASDFPEFPGAKTTKMVSVGFVELDGKRYEKMMDSSHLKSMTNLPNSRSLVSQPGLFSGDMIKRGKLSHIERLSGNLIISSSNSLLLASIAKAHQLEISYSNNNMAILKAPQGKELISLLNALKADSRIKVANLERITNKLTPQ